MSIVFRFSPRETGEHEKQGGLWLKINEILSYSHSILHFGRMKKSVLVLTVNVAIHLKDF